MLFVAVAVGAVAAGAGAGAVDDGATCLSLLKLAVFCCCCFLAFFPTLAS